MGRSTEFYRKNPRSRRAKNRYQKKFNEQPSQVRKRTILNRENRKRKTYGNGDGKDLSHTDKGLVYKDQHVNRGSSSDQPGDRRARGRRRRRKK